MHLPRRPNVPLDYLGCTRRELMAIFQRSRPTRRTGRHNGCSAPTASRMPASSALTATHSATPLAHPEVVYACAHEIWPQSAIMTGLAVLPLCEPTASMALTT